MYALNASTGAMLWSYNTATRWTPRPPWRMGWFMSARTTATCTRWMPAPAPSCGATLPAAVVDSSPAVVNGVVYVGSDDGNVYAFGLK